MLSAECVAPMRLVLLLGLPGFVAADLRVAAYEYPGYYNHWPGAAGMKQFSALKVKNGRGICVKAGSPEGQCLGNDSRCRVSSEAACKSAQAGGLRCEWKAKEAAYTRHFTRTTEECQQLCGMDKKCQGYQRRGICKLYMVNMTSKPYKFGSTCMKAAGLGHLKQMHAKYMVPSTFAYQGLINQKKRNYDQFLRSNIDNEHDNRNFETEDGEDALPFRTDHSEVYSTEKGAGKYSGKSIDLYATMKPGEEMLVPLRWNNPHASELEVNIWIFQADKPIVVPVKKPTCSGEGYQDNIIKFTIPTDFHKLGSKIPGFKGCNKDTKPPCTLQVYSHSVESRTYANAAPIVVTGHDDSLTTSSTKRIEPMTKDPVLDMTNLREICRPSFDPDSDHKKAVPRWARLVSDVANHAYQNSDFSPYSGQQHESISRNLQASAVNKMVSGNRGELGRNLLSFETSKRLRALRTLENRLYRNYESVANKIIKDLGSQMLQTQGRTISAEGSTQTLGKCFRCGEVGSLMRKRLETNTYIPSFQLPSNLRVGAQSLVPEKYKSLITSDGTVQIYMATLSDLNPFFYASMSHGILYQPAVWKSTLKTKQDKMKFRRIGVVRDGSMRRRGYDRGERASSFFLMEQAEAHGCDLTSCSTNKTICADEEKQPPGNWSKNTCAKQKTAGHCTKPWFRQTGYCKTTCGLCQAKSAWCAGGHAKPLTKMHTATCITGKCEGCGAFFGKTKKIEIPIITPMAKEIAASGTAPGGISTIPAYPDPDGSPRVGRPGSNITGETDQWKLVDGPAPKPGPNPKPVPAPSKPVPAPSPGKPGPDPKPVPAPSPGATLRRRKGASRRRGLRRRKGAAPAPPGKGGRTVPSIRRRSGKSRRRSGKSRRRSTSAALIELAKDVAMLQVDM